MLFTPSRPGLTRRVGLLAGPEGTGSPRGHIVTLGLLLPAAPSRDLEAFPRVAVA